MVKIKVNSSASKPSEEGDNSRDFQVDTLRKAGVEYFDHITLDLPNGKRYEFPNDPLVSFNFVKKIVETPITDTDRQVVETITIMRWSITIKGRLIGENGYPFDELTEMVEVCKMGPSLPIQSKILNAIDVTQVVIKQPTFPELAGEEEVQPYVVACISDQPIELEIIQL